MYIYLYIYIYIYTQREWENDRNIERFDDMNYDDIVIEHLASRMKPKVFRMWFAQLGSATATNIF